MSSSFLMNVSALLTLPRPESSISNFRIDGQCSSIFRDHERVDFDRYRLKAEVNVYEFQGYVGNLQHFLVPEPCLKTEVNHPGKARPFQRIEEFRKERFGMPLGHFLDVHASLCGDHEKGLEFFGIESDADVKLPGLHYLFFDKNSVYRFTLDLHRKEVRGCF